MLLILIQTIIVQLTSVLSKLNGNSSVEFYFPDLLENSRNGILNLLANYGLPSNYNFYITYFFKPIVIQDYIENDIQPMLLLF